MRAPNGFGTVARLSGNRRRPFIIKKTVGWNDKGHPIYDIIVSRARSISSKMLELYAEKTIDEVLIIYTRMDQHNQFTVDVEQLLPLYRLNHEVEVDGQTIHSIQLEPSPTELLNIVIPDYLSGFIYSALVESYASENFARMQAMDSANKNGEELLNSLSLQYNRQRQAKITQEITEVAAGAKARRQQLQKKKRSQSTCK